MVLRRIRAAKSWPIQGHERRPRELLERAYELAFFLHRHEETALRIAIEALAKLEMIELKQGQRFYYQPTRRRTKVILSRPQLLQSLVYGQSVPYEDARICNRSRKVPLPPSPEELTVWFIKHLVAITVKRNAFYVALGVCRLLCHYSTQETIKLYDLVSQDSDCRFGDDYCRSRKRVLMGELAQRFGKRLTTRRESHGEIRFLPSEGSRPINTLVGRCFERFTPWGTSCKATEKTTPLNLTHAQSNQTIHPCRRQPSQNGEPTDELDRMHAFLHPPCLASYTGRLGLESPSACLTVPRFHP